MQGYVTEPFSHINSSYQREWTTICHLMHEYVMDRGRRERPIILLYKSLERDLNYIESTNIQITQFVWLLFTTF